MPTFGNIPIAKPIAKTNAVAKKPVPQKKPTNIFGQMFGFGLCLWGVCTVVQLFVGGVPQHYAPTATCDAATAQDLAESATRSKLKFPSEASFIQEEIRQYHGEPCHYFVTGYVTAPSEAGLHIRKAWASEVRINGTTTATIDE